MAQANERRGSLARFSLRAIATIVGLVGAVVALIIVLLYTVFNVLGRVVGVTNDSTHFFWGIFLVLFGAVGAFLATLYPPVAEIMLAVAGIGLFFVVGWWAIIAAPFLLVAALLTFSNQRVNVPGAE